MQGFESRDEIISHAKYRHKALWMPAEAASHEVDRNEVYRQEGRDEMRAELLPQLQEMPELIRRDEHCRRHHLQMPPLTPRPGYQH